jgi:hypothetical protein
MTCRSCGAELPAPSRRNKRYCDARCRRRAFEQRRREAELELALVVPIADEATLEQTSVWRSLDEARLVSLIVAEAERGTWRAAAWLLERAFPASWAPARRPSRPEPEQHEFDPSDPFYEIDMLASKRRRKGASRPRAAR